MNTEFNKNDFYFGAGLILAGALVAKLMIKLFSIDKKCETMFVTVPTNNYWVASKQVPVLHVTHKENGVLMHSLYFADNTIEANVENFDDLNEAIETMVDILKR